MSELALVDTINDPGRRSWVTSANFTDCDFPIQCRGCPTEPLRSDT